MYDTLHVHINKPETKKEIKAAADSLGMSVSKFMLFAYESIKPDLAKFSEVYQRRIKIK